MRYWISRSTGVVEGPFDIPTLQAMLEEGAITNATQLCLEGTETWQALSTVGALQPDAPPTDVESARQQVETLPAPVEGKEYSLGNAMTLGWECVQKNYGLILCMVLMWIGMYLVQGFVTGSMNVVMSMNGGVPQQTAVGGGPFGSNITLPTVWDMGGRILEWLVITPYLVGVVMVAVRLHRGEKVDWSDSWCAFRNGNYGRIVLVQLCWLGLSLVFLAIVAVLVGLPVYFVYSKSGEVMTDGAGALLLIGGACALLVGIYFYLRLSFTNLIVIDPRCGRPSLVDCFKGSWAATRGWETVGSLFVLGVILVLITILTALMCFLPFILIGAPILFATQAAAYALLIPARTRFNDGDEFERPWQDDSGPSAMPEG